MLKATVSTLDAGLFVARATSATARLKDASPSNPWKVKPELSKSYQKTLCDNPDVTRMYVSSCRSNERGAVRFLFGIGDQPEPLWTLRTHALITLGRLLRSRGYRFVAVTPATHCRVLARPAATGTLELIFGWNRPFDRAEVDDNIVELLEDAKSLEVESGLYRSSVRFATNGELLFVHSSFPTAEQDAVFFGPDTYRFVRLLRASIADMAASESMTLIDVGSGSGAGGNLCGSPSWPTR